MPADVSLVSLSPLWCQDKQGRDNIYPPCLSWGFAGLTADGSASLKAAGGDERERRVTSHPSADCMTPRFAVSRHTR